MKALCFNSSLGIRTLFGIATLTCFTFATPLFVKANLEDFMRECDKNISGSCQNVALVYDYDEKDAQKYIQYYIKACDLDAIYCDSVADAYETGYNGVPINLPKAIIYYKRSCDRSSDATTCGKVAYAYETGEGAERNITLARDYYIKTCEQSRYGSACEGDDFMQAMIETNENDIAKALEKSCITNDNGFSCVKAGLIYEYNVSVARFDLCDYWGDTIRTFSTYEVPPRDLDKALDYYEKGCELGEISGCYYAKQLRQKLDANSTTATDRNQTIDYDLSNIESDLKDSKNLEKYKMSYIYDLPDAIPVSKSNLTTYNNIAYYLEQNKRYVQAAYLLREIVRKFPKRTVAYINLGDAYYGLNKLKEAKEAYQTYISQMKASGKTNKIPSRVFERVK